MRWGKRIPGYRLAKVLVIGTVLAGVCLAQKPAAHPASPPPRQAQQQPIARQAAPPSQKEGHAAAQAQGHAGDWLRRYKDLSPQEQESELQKDPAFHRLPKAQQERYLQRLQNFSNLPPQRQLQILNRMETWEHLTRDQKQEARQVWGQMKQLPPGRRRMVHTAIDDLRSMPADQRENVINSDRFKGMFSDQERGLMRDATRLPLAPPDSGDQPGQPEQ